MAGVTGVLAACFGKFMLVQRHIHARSTKSNAFHAEAKSLLSGLFTGQFDGPTRTDDALPGQSRDLPQDANDLPGGSLPACGPGNRSVG